MVDPELESVEAFASYLLAEDRSSFSFAEATALADSLGVHVSGVIRELKSYGFAQDARPIPKAVRGFLTSSHDRYYGPGSSPSHGGSGWEQIGGLAGRAG